MKNKPKLNKEEVKVYKGIAQTGNMDMMFDFGYLVGQERAVIEISKKITNDNYEK